MKISVVPVLAVVSAVALAQSPLPLQHGTYVATGTACKDAPFAMMQMVNASGIQYPHLWGCKAQVVKQAGNMYSLDQTCNGGEHDRIVVSVLSPKLYSVGQGKMAQKFRFCSAKLP